MVRHLLVLPDGTEVFSGTGAENAIQSVTLTECVNSETELHLGSTCAAMLEIKLITPAGGLSAEAGDQVTLYEVGDAGERVLLGKFLLEKPTRPSANTMQFTAYDFISKLDKDLTAWLAGLEGWPYRLDAFAWMVCAACGVQLKAGELPNGGYLIQKFSADGITGRQLMAWAAQAAGRFCRATPEGEIEFAWYVQNPEAIGPGGERYYYQGSLTYEDYKVAPIERVRIQLTGDDVGVAWPDNEGEANTYAVTGNYLLTAGSSVDLLPVAQALYETLQGFTYTPCKVSVPASLGIRAGDILTVTDKNGKVFTTLVMTRTRSSGRDTLESTGSPRRDSASALNNITMRQVMGRVFEIRKSLEGLRMTVSQADLIRQEEMGELWERIERNIAELNILSDSIDASIRQYDESLAGISEQIAQLRLTAEGLSLSVQHIQQDGVDQVTTKTGYTFNADGMRVHQDGDDIDTVISNDGMRVVRGSGENELTMLQADSRGVIATDLTARTYLTVGAYARLENYNNGTDSKRTACFHLGGDEDGTAN